MKTFPKAILQKTVHADAIPKKVQKLHFSVLNLFLFPLQLQSQCRTLRQLQKYPELPPQNPDSRFHLHNLKAPVQIFQEWDGALREYLVIGKLQS